MPQKLETCVKKLRQKWQDDPGSKPNLGDRTEEQAAYAICRASLKLEQEQAITLEGGNGPALVAVAVTAKPHLRQRGHEIKVIKGENGDPLVEIPIFRQGVYRHPRGKLVLNNEFFDKMIENHENSVTDYGVILDFRHTDKMGTLAFLDKQDGGWLEKKDGWLMAYGPPVGEEEIKLIESRKWRYASGEFFTDYKSNLVHKLSSDDLDEITYEELLLEEEEVKMPQKFKFGDDIVISVNDADGALTLEKESVEGLKKLAGTFAEINTKIGTLESEAQANQTRVEQLEAQLAQGSGDNDNNDDENDGAQSLEENETIKELRRELESLRLERNREKVAVIMHKARDYRDSNGNGHDEHFLGLAKAGLTLSEFKNGSDKPIKLEANADVDAVTAYYQNLFRVMLETCPGTVPMTPKAKGDEDRLEFEIGSDGENRGFTDEELEAEFKNFENF